MGTPAIADTDNKEDQVVEPTEEEVFSSTVAEVVAGITRGEDGKYVIPSDVPKEVRFAAITEKRRRDTQSEFTKVAQKAKALEAENTALKKRAIANVKIDLTPEQKEELDDLRFSDPDEWRKKMNALERNALGEQQQKLDEEMGQVSADILNKEELKRRETVLKEFLQEHSGFQLDDDVIKNDIPPRITKRLETGDISFEAFLQEVYDYTKTGKVVKQEEVRQQPNLSKAGGGTTLDKHAETTDIVLSYNKEVF